MKLVSNVLEGMTGIHIFYVIGLLLFFILFIVIFVRTMRFLYERPPARPEREAERHLYLGATERQDR